MFAVTSKVPARTQEPNIVMLAVQKIQEIKLQVSSQNLANAFTAGFKAFMFQPEEVVIKTPDHKKISFIKDNQTTRDLRDGALNITKNPLDFGLSGQGYFMIQTPQGIRYTRNGQFTRDSNGRLVTASGHPVLNAGGGEIILPTSIKDFTVSDSGDITLNKTSAGRIGIVSFENEHSMHLEGDSMLSTTQEAILTPLKAFKVTQGAYEESNISSVNESIKLMETMRRFEEAQKLINQYEELKKKMMNASPRNV